MLVILWNYDNCVKLIHVIFPFAKDYKCHKTLTAAEALKKPMKPECSRKQLPKMCGLPTGEKFQQRGKPFEESSWGGRVPFWVGFVPGIPQDLCYIDYMYICIYIYMCVFLLDLHGFSKSGSCEEDYHA